MPTVPATAQQACLPLKLWLTRTLGDVEKFPPTETPPMPKAFRVLVDRASSQLEQAQLQQKLYAESSRRPLEFSVSESVWLSTLYFAPRGSPKFQQRYVVPFPILELTGKVACKLQLPLSMQIHPIFHVSRLAPDRRRPQEMQATITWEPISAENGYLQVYEVEHTLDMQGEGPTAKHLVQ